MSNDLREWIKMDCNLEQCLSRLTDNKSNFKNSFEETWTPTPSPEKIFLYFYHDQMTQERSFPVPGFFDISRTVYVSKLEPNNMMLKPNAQELIIISPPYESTTIGSYIDRLTRCLVHPLSSQIKFDSPPNVKYYNISFRIPDIDIDKKSLNGFASLLLNNTVQLIKGGADPRKGSIKKKLYQDILDTAGKQVDDIIGKQVDSFVSLFKSKPKSRRDIFRKSPRLLINVKASPTFVEDNQTAISIKKEGDKISLQEIGLGAALGLFYDSEKSIKVPQSTLSSLVKGYESEADTQILITKSLNDESFVPSIIS